MIKILQRHIKNDIKEIQAAWHNMDTFSHVLVLMFITLVLLSGDILANRIHW